MTTQNTTPTKVFYEPDKYHDGKSPSAWAMFYGGAIASIIVAVGCVLGPNWMLVIVGSVLFVLSGVVAMVLSRRGLSNRVAR